MLQSNATDTRLHLSHALHHSLGHFDSSEQHDPSLRKKLHSLMTENFSLKETIASLQAELKTAGEGQVDLRGQLRSALEEISANDNIIERLKNNEGELKEYINQCENDINVLKTDLQQEKEAVGRLMEHNKNLETEAQLMAEIKQKYQVEHARSKVEIEHCQAQTQQFTTQNAQLSLEVGQLLKELDGQQEEIRLRRKEMEEYEAYVLSKLNGARDDPEFHQNCLVERDRYYCKYLKYKEKAGVYRRQRDELLSHLSAVGEEVGSASMRRYVQ